MQTVPSVEQQCALAVLTFMPLSESSDTAKQSLTCICEVGVLHESKVGSFQGLKEDWRVRSRAGTSTVGDTHGLIIVDVHNLDRRDNKGFFARVPSLEDSKALFQTILVARCHLDA